MSDLKVDGFKSSDIVVALSSTFAGFSAKEQEAQKKKTNGIFELRISNAAKEEAVWTIDLKSPSGDLVYKGPARPKADVTLLMADDTFAKLASGELNGQKAFMTGKLKTKGNVMLATKLDGVLKTAQSKAKL